MVNDTLSDMLTRIRNANLAKSHSVSVPFTRLSEKICEILEKEGFIETFQVSEALPTNELLITLKYSGRTKKPCITNLRRISKPGLRIYVNQKEIPKILGGMGIIILSTSDGVLTDREARLQGIGGELLCSIW
jgi:small subunit ribosomal protein S8